MTCVIYILYIVCI